MLLLNFVLLYVFLRLSHYYYFAVPSLLTLVLDVIKLNFIFQYIF